MKGLEERGEGGRERERERGRAGREFRINNLPSKAKTFKFSSQFVPLELKRNEKRKIEGKICKETIMNLCKYCQWG